MTAQIKGALVSVYSFFAHLACIPDYRGCIVAQETIAKAYLRKL